MTNVSLLWSLAHIAYLFWGVLGWLCVRPLAWVLLRPPHRFVSVWGNLEPITRGPAADLRKASCDVLDAVEFNKTNKQALFSPF